MADETTTEDAEQQEDYDYQDEDVPQDDVIVMEEDPAEDERKAKLEEALQQITEEPGDAEGLAAGGGGAKGSPATMVAEARKHLGYRESGNNDTKFNRWNGAIPGYPHSGYGYPWCHSFISYCLAHSGNAGAGPRTAGCSAGVGWFRSKNRWHSTPKAGDIVYYGPGGGTHVELVVAVGPSTIKTIGGNTSGSAGGSFHNGDGVYEKTVARSGRVAGYGRPNYGANTPPSGGGGGGGGGGGAGKPMTSVRSVKGQQQACNALGRTPKVDVDNEWGPKTAAAVKWLQKKVGCAADGQWGKHTEAKYLAARKKQ